MRRSFWPNRIFQRFGAKNRSTGLNFTPIRKNSRLSMKIVENLLFTLCGGRFGQIAFFNVSEPKIALLDWILRQYVKTVGFLWKLYKTCFSRYAENVLAKSHFSTFGSQKSPKGRNFTPIRKNSRLSMKIVQNVLFTLCGECFGQIAFFNVCEPKIAQRTEFHANTWKQ